MGTRPNRVIRVFIGPFGLHAGWRVLLFLLFTAVIAAALQFLTRMPLARGWGSEFPTFFVSVMCATWIMARIEGKPFWSFGLGPVSRLRNLASGVAAGFLGLSLLMGLLMAASAFHPRGPDIHGVEIARWALYWTGSFLLVALSEELLTRGYALFALSQGIGFWPAAALLALLFGAGHIGNRGEEFVGIANAVLAGVVFAYSVRWTGTLWWAIGFHLAWDWGETFFYGVPNSGGSVSPHHFLTGSPDGPAWLSGGMVGPEGSVVATFVLLAMAGVVRWTSLKYENPDLDRKTAQPLVRNLRSGAGV